MTDLLIVRGDDSTIDVAVTSDDVALSVADALAVTFTAKRAATDADIDAVLRKDLDGGITVDIEGIHVTFEAADTRDLAAPMALVWDLEVVDSDGLTHTVSSGYLTLAADVTRTGFAAGSGS